MRRFVLDFPYSNVGPSQLMPGENAECACQALRDIFEWLGGVPPRIVFDNAAGVGRRTFERVRLTRLFQSFQAHYGFEYVFCNAYAGHEKGGVESRVGAVRRKLFVPVPSVRGHAVVQRQAARTVPRAGRQGPLPQGRARDGPVRRGPQGAAGAAGDTLRRGRVETHEGRQVRDRHRRGQTPVRGRPRACGARAGRRAARVRGSGRLDASGARITTHPRAYGDNPTSSKRPVPADRAAVATGPGPGPTARSGRRFPTRCANGSTGRHARSSPRGCARPARAERESGWANAVAAMAEILETTGGIDRAGVCLAAARHAAGTEPVAYDEPVDPTRIRPGVRREGGQRMSQRNEERTDIDRLRARARALFISQATIDDLLAWATPRQLQAVDRLLHTELDNRETSKRARLLRRARFPVPKTLDGHGLHEREAARRVRPGRAALPGLRRQGPGPRVLREDRTRQDPPGHRAGHERDRPGHERTLPAHRRARPSAGPRQARGNPRDHAQGHRQSRPDHPGTGSATCPSTSTAPDCSTRSSPAATSEGASSPPRTSSPDEWGTIFADDKLAASIIDRIVHHGRLIEFTGQSHRISQALMFGKPQNQ